MNGHRGGQCRVSFVGVVMMGVRTAAASCHVRMTQAGAELYVAVSGRRRFVVGSRSALLPPVLECAVKYTFGKQTATFG